MNFFVSDTNVNYITKLTASHINGPEIIHKPIQNARRDTDITITALIKDEFAITKAHLHYRSGLETFSFVPLIRLPEGMYAVKIPYSELTGYAFNYYFSAENEAGIISYFGAGGLSNIQPLNSISIPLSYY